MAHDGPNVLVVEDAHWCDPASLEVLLGLVSMLEGGNVGMVVTTRPEGSGYQRLLEGMAPARADRIRGGTHDLTIHLDAGKPLAGTVRTTAGDVIPAFTLLVLERQGSARDIVLARSIVDPAGRFAVRVRDDFCATKTTKTT